MLQKSLFFKFALDKNSKMDSVLTLFEVSVTL